MHTGYYMSVYLVWYTYDVNMTQNHWSMRLNFSLTLETAHHWTHNHSGQHLFWGWRTCILELTNRWRRYMNHLEFSAADKESDLSDWLYTILNDFIETFFFSESSSWWYWNPETGSRSFTMTIGRRDPAKFGGLGFGNSQDVSDQWLPGRSHSTWVLPKIGVPPKHPKMIIFSRKTHGCWVPPFLETSTCILSKRCLLTFAFHWGASF